MMDKLDAALTGGRDAQLSVIGSMLIDDRCVPLVLRKLRPEDFVDGTCRSTFKAIQKLAREGWPVDVLTVLDTMQGGDRYVEWMWQVHDRTPTAANVEEYIGIVRRSSTLYRLREMADKMLLCADLEDAEALVRKMSSILSATDRMPRMTGAELAADFLARMRSEDKPEYLPWGLPTADRSVYAELGDMILLGGYASSGKTLLSILMAMTQAKRGYKVGYYSLETRPEKMADRMFASLTKVPLNRIKTRNFTGGDCIYADGIRIYAAVDSMPEKILDVLAVELQTPAYSQKFSIEVKRTLVKGTFSFYARMGTPTACNKIIEAIFGSGRIEEWFDYDGEPHHFRAYAGDGRVDARDLAEFRQVLGHIKRLSSWLDEIIITLPVTYGTVSITPILGPRQSERRLPAFHGTLPPGKFCVTPVLGVRSSTITLPWAAKGRRDSRSAEPNDVPGE